MKLQRKYSAGGEDNKEFFTETFLFDKTLPSIPDAEMNRTRPKPLTGYKGQASGQPDHQQPRWRKSLVIGEKIIAARITLERNKV